MKENLGALVTESQNLDYVNLDEMNSEEIVRAMNKEDKKVALAVEKEIPNIAKAVDKIVDSFKKGGRLFYVGAGTSGRLGVLDASECPPTFGVDPEMVQPVMAGGESAFIKALEGAEDDEDLGRKDILERDITENDTVVGITASGRTPYVAGALKAAKEKGAKTVAVVCNPGSLLTEIAEVTIAPVVGPEVLTGSTRLKAGTAQKMVLNMLTTAAMVKMGKTYGNIMVDLMPTNNKLRERSKRILMLLADVELDEAEKILLQTNWQVKEALVMLLADVDLGIAKKELDISNGFVKLAVKNILSQR